MTTQAYHRKTKQRIGNTIGALLAFALVAVACGTPVAAPVTSPEEPTSTSPPEESLQDENLLQRENPWQSADVKNRPYSIAWGDIDGDTFPELAVGQENWTDGYGLTRLYKRTDGDKILDSNYAWTLTLQDAITSVAWGDVDRDGDLDLAVGTNGTGMYVYRNENGQLANETFWRSDDGVYRPSLAWGDVNGDDYPELAVTGFHIGPILYSNDMGTLSKTANTWSVSGDKATSLAWGDMDNDGDLDLAVGRYEDGNEVYLNNEGDLQYEPAWTSAENAPNETTVSVAWGDIDGDGYPELAVANDMGATIVYKNDNGQLLNEDPWSPIDLDGSTSLAWGDMDNDGDLDLAVGSSGSGTRVYRNNNEGLPAEASWNSEDCDNVTSIAWGDADGDGDLDLAIGVDSGVVKIYLNSLAENEAH